MADFVQMMKDWRRMCKHYSDESVGDGQLSCEDVCPLGHNTVCGIIEDALDSDIEAMAKEVAKWAAEHPVVYPTWGEYLASIGVMKPAQPDKAYEVWFTQLYSTNIPADIAKKLGIEPKEAR